jgi:transporter family-2 protein
MQMSLSTFLSCCFVVAAGVSVALQQVLNANLRAQIGSPWWAGAVSYLVGLIVMLAVAIPSSRPSIGGNLLGSGAWFNWMGGFFGAVFIAVVILMIPRLGAATTLALIVVGQMAGALVFDHFGLFGVQPHPVSLIRVAGVACLILGVVLVRR